MMLSGKKRTPFSRIRGRVIVLVTGLLLALASALGQVEEEEAEEEVFELEAFEVYSRGIVTAIEDKRNSRFIGSFVGGEGLESLPDDNIGDALNRLVGVNVVEGDKVSIRGLEGKLNKLTIDGGSISSSNSELGGLGNDTRNFDVSSIPVEAIERIEVVKTLTPDRDADAIGGQVNLVTADAFETQERDISFKAEGRYAENGDRYGYGLSLTYRDALNESRTLGLTLSLSMRDEETVRWGMEQRQSNLPNWLLGKNPEAPLLPPFEAIPTTIPLPERFDLRERTTAERRYNLNGTLSYRLSEATKLYLKPFLSFRSREETRYRIQMRNLDNGDDAVFLNNPEERRIVFSGRPTLFFDPALTSPYKSMDQARVDRRGRYRPDRSEEQYRLLAGGETRLGDGTLTYRLSLSGSSAENDEERYRFDMPDTAYREGWRLTYDYTQVQFPEFPSAVALAALPNGEFSSTVPYPTGPVDPPAPLPAAYEEEVISRDGEPIDLFASELGAAEQLLDHVRFQELDYEDFEWMGQMDYHHRFGTDLRIELQTGFKILQRDRSSRVQLRQFSPLLPEPGGGGGGAGFASTPDLTLFQDGLRPPLQAFSGRYANLGRNPRLGAVTAFYFDNEDRFFRAGNPEALRASARMYDAREEITAGYLRLDLSTGPVDWITGMRVEVTDTDYTWRASLVEKPVPTLPDLDDVNAKNNYTNWFPHLSAIYRWRENHLLRAAVTTSIARPDFEDLVPWNTFTVNDLWGVFNDPNNASREDQTIGKGSPDLKAQESLNFDLAYEWYFGTGNNLSIGVFRKEITNFIFLDEVSIPVGGDIGNQPLTQPFNGGEQLIEGLEFSFVYNDFDQWLPSPLDGLGLVFNLTLIEGEQDEPIFFWEDEIDDFVQRGVRVGQELSGQPGRIINVQLSWEKYDWAVRLAYNSVDELKVNTFDVGFATLQAPKDTLDLSVQYRFENGLRVFFEGKNLTNEPFESTFRSVPTFPESYTEKGRSFVIGIRGSL